MSSTEIQGLIAKYMKIRVKDYKDIVKATGIKQSTYYRKMANPEEFSVKELRQILDYLKVPREERII